MGKTPNTAISHVLQTFKVLSPLTLWVKDFDRVSCNEMHSTFSYLVNPSKMQVVWNTGQARYLALFSLSTKISEPKLKSSCCNHLSLSSNRNAGPRVISIHPVKLTTLLTRLWWTPDVNTNNTNTRYQYQYKCSPGWCWFPSNADEVVVNARCHTLVFHLCLICSCMSFNQVLYMGHRSAKQWNVHFRLWLRAACRANKAWQ